MSKKSYPATRGLPVTEPSGRPTDRAPHMGRYAMVGQRYGKAGVDIVVGNQAFFMPVTVDDTLTEEQIDAHVQWTRDMVCIALDTLVELEVKRRAGDGA